MTPFVSRGVGGVVIFRGDARTVDLLCPNRRNKGLKPLVPHDPLTADLGFRVKRRQALSPLLPGDGNYDRKMTTKPTIIIITAATRFIITPSRWPKRNLARLAK